MHIGVGVEEDAEGEDVVGCLVGLWLVWGGEEGFADEEAHNEERCINEIMLEVGNQRVWSWFGIGSSLIFIRGSPEIIEGKLYIK